MYAASFLGLTNVVVNSHGLPAQLGHMQGFDVANAIGALLCARLLCRRAREPRRRHSFADARKVALETVSPPCGASTTSSSSP